LLSSLELVGEDIADDAVARRPSADHRQSDNVFISLRAGASSKTKTADATTAAPKTVLRLLTAVLPWLIFFL